MHEFFPQAKLQCDLISNEQSLTSRFPILKKERHRKKKKMNSPQGQSAVLGTILSD